MTYVYSRDLRPNLTKRNNNTVCGLGCGKRALSIFMSFGSDWGV